jgi:hypothetical protein
LTIQALAGSIASESNSGERSACVGNPERDPDR